MQYAVLQYAPQIFHAFGAGQSQCHWLPVHHLSSPCSIALTACTLRTTAEPYQHLTDSVTSSRLHATSSCWLAPLAAGLQALRKQC